MRSNFFSLWLGSGGAFNVTNSSTFVSLLFFCFISAWTRVLSPYSWLIESCADLLLSVEAKQIIECWEFSLTRDAFCGSTNWCSIVQTFENVVFSHNTARNGGVVFATNSSRVNLRDCDVVGNSALHTGGIATKISTRIVFYCCDTIDAFTNRRCYISC